MPVVFRIDMVSFEVRRFQTIRSDEFGNRLTNPAEPPKVVPVHMAGVRNRRSSSRVNRAVCQCFFNPAAVLMRVRQVVMCGEVIRQQSEGAIVKGNRARRAALSAVCWIW